MARTVRLPASVWAWLDARAAATDTTCAGIVGDVVRAAEARSATQHAPRNCGCSPYAGWQECSWSQFVASLPPDDPIRIRDEAGDPNLSWEHPDWSGEGCRCACHDGQD